MRRIVGLIALVTLALPARLHAQAEAPFTHADTLRGSIGPARAWWDVVFYDLDARVSTADSSIAGHVGITYRVIEPGRELQIDLQEPMRIDSVLHDGRALRFRRDGNAYFVSLHNTAPAGAIETVVVHYHGQPRIAQNAPWDGGLVIARDSLERPWLATANQGLGASVWWPNKDTQTDEPDSQRIRITVPDGLMNVSNGRLRSVVSHGDMTTFEWFVRSPINNYDVAINAAHYAHFGGVYRGEAGLLTLDFWPLDYNEDAARRQFAQVQPMLACFERWFGPYPWYDDGYKLVETPHLGMEHQSAVAYGNHYQQGYRGRDLSRTGLGLDFDFIIVHESAHEWWGNSLTGADLADMWIHESFANYAEALYVECQKGVRAGADYVVGVRSGISNDEPIIAAYGVNAEGSGDMYPKGGNMLHTIRQLVGDDAHWREMLRGLQHDFRHRVITSRELWSYLDERTPADLEPVFRQYLTTTMVPTLEYEVSGATLRYRWADVVPGFAMPVEVRIGPGACTKLEPTTTWQSILAGSQVASTFDVDRNYYVRVKAAGAAWHEPRADCDA